MKETRKLEAPGCFGGYVITVGCCSSGITSVKGMEVGAQHQAVSWGLCLQAKPMTGYVVALSTIRQRASQATAAPQCPRGCQYSGAPTCLGRAVGFGEQRLDQLPRCSVLPTEMLVGAVLATSEVPRALHRGRQASRGQEGARACCQGAGALPGPCSDPNLMPTNSSAFRSQICNEWLKKKAICD